MCSKVYSSMLELPYPQSSTKSCPGDTRSTNKPVIRSEVCSGFPVYSDTVYHVDSINLIFLTCKKCTNTELNGDNAVDVTSYCCCIYKYLLTFLLYCINKNKILTFTIVSSYFIVILNYLYWSGIGVFYLKTRVWHTLGFSICEGMHTCYSG